MMVNKNRTERSTPLFPISLILLSPFLIWLIPSLIIFLQVTASMVYCSNALILPSLDPSLIRPAKISRKQKSPRNSPCDGEIKHFTHTSLQ